MSEKGKIISQAYEILKRTYKEIYRLKDEIGDLLTEYDDTIKYYDEYSYSPNSLFLKPYHTFFFRQKIDFRLDEGPLRALVVVCLFDEYSGMDRVNLKDEPELWVGLLEINDKLQNCRAPVAYSVLSVDERSYFDRELIIGGDIFHYRYVEEPGSGQEERKEWKGEFLGYPLVEITDRAVVREKILEKLFQG